MAAPLIWTADSTTVTADATYATADGLAPIQPAPAPYSMERYVDGQFVTVIGQWIGTPPKVGA
jgi:hypothetical protein